MTDWQSQEELLKDVVVFDKFMHALLGVYVYEWVISLYFEWEFITGKKKFRWPLIFYFANRYLLLFCLVGVVISLDVTTTRLNCEALYLFSELAGDASVGLASINLAIRTMAIWSQNRFIIGLLVLLILGHWSLILQGTQLKATWIPGAGCAITEFNNKIFSAIFIYSMCFDLTVLMLNIYKIVGLRWNSQAKERLNHSRLTQMIFKDGLVYFFLAFLANVIATVFMLLNLNKIMGVIFNVPAAVISTIVACRAVRRLSNFSFDGPQVFNVTSNSIGKSSGGVQSVSYKASAQPGVHVQMETFTHHEEQNNDFFIKSKLDLESQGQDEV